MLQLCDANGEIAHEHTPCLRPRRQETGGHKYSLKLRRLLRDVAYVWPALRNKSQQDQTMLERMLRWMLRSFGRGLIIDASRNKNMLILIMKVYSNYYTSNIQVWSYPGSNSLISNTHVGSI